MNQETKISNPRCSLCGKDKEIRYCLCSDNCLKRQWNKQEFFKQYEALKENKNKKRKSL